MDRLAREIIWTLVTEISYTLPHENSKILFIFNI